MTRWDFCFLLFCFVYDFKNQNRKFLFLGKTSYFLLSCIAYGFENQNNKFPWLSKNFVSGSFTLSLTSKTKREVSVPWPGICPLFFCLVYGYKTRNWNFLRNFVSCSFTSFMASKTKSESFYDLIRPLFLVLVYGFNFQEEKFL